MMQNEHSGIEGRASGLLMANGMQYYRRPKVFCNTSSLHDLSEPLKGRRLLRQVVCCPFEGVHPESIQAGAMKVLVTLRRR